MSRTKESGFALVIALSLMAFVVLLILSLTSLIRIEVGAQRNSMDLMAARQNALLGLQIALGQLQAHAGNDAVATAPASIWDPTAGEQLFLNKFESTNPSSGERSERERDFRRWWNDQRQPRWTGVFKPSPGTEDPLPEWLVSGNESQTIDDGDMAYPSGYFTPDMQVDPSDDDFALVVGDYQGKAVEALSYEVDPIGWTGSWLF